MRYESGETNNLIARNYGSASGIYYLHTHTGNEDVYIADQLMYALHTLLKKQLSIAVRFFTESPEITGLFCGNAPMLVLLM